LASKQYGSFWNAVEKRSIGNKLRGGLMKDQLIQALDVKKGISAIVVDCSTAAIQLARGHLSGPVASNCLSQALSAVSMLGTELDANEEVVSFKMTCSGPLGGFLVESTKSHTLRGYTNKKIFEDFDGLGTPKDSKLIGPGATFEIIRSVPGKITASGSVAIEISEKDENSIARGLEECFTRSFQRRAKIALATMSEDGGVPIFARGVLVECMPDGDIEAYAEISKLFDDGTILKSMSSQMFSSSSLLKKLPSVKMELRSEEPVSFMCRCSAERAASMIASLPDKSDLPPTLDVTCHMCGRTWTIKTGN
jgi:redox-regulated HSP33 family molecular chaperone